MTLELVEGRFELFAVAGEGGMARVFYARDVQRDASVAVKVLHDDCDPATTKLFRREIDVLSRLRHPNIVGYVTHGTTPTGAAFLAMDWIDGGDLRARLRCGAMSVSETLVVATRIASALAHMHAQGVIHADIKPSNIALAGGTLEGATLIDVGIARFHDAPSSSDTSEVGAIVGTPGYMSPEQMLDQVVTPAVDTFALGGLIFKCVTGAGPFAARDVTAVLARVLYDEPPRLDVAVQGVPSALADLVASMLSKTPDARPSMAHVLETLGRLRVAPSSQAGASPIGLSAREQRIISVVVAGDAAVGDEEATLRRAAAPDVDVTRLRALATRFGAKIAVLPNGALVAALETTGTAGDLATRAARYALALGLRFERAPIVVATGRAELGEYVAGEVIDRASALGAAGAGGTIAIDDVTAGLIATTFDVDFVAGRHLLRRERFGGELPRTVLGKRTTTVGRANELGWLLDAFDESRDTPGLRVALVLGSAGIGKSRLRHELASEVRAQAHVWTARAHSSSAPTPYGLLVSLLGSEIGTGRAEPIDVACERLARALVKMVSDAASHVAIRRAFGELLAQRAATRSLVVLLEDLQYRDAQSFDVLTAALEPLGGARVFVAGFANPEIDPAVAGLWQQLRARTLRLNPLSVQAAGALVRQLLGNVQSKTVSSLVERGEGNPYYLEEIVSASQARGDADALRTLLGKPTPCVGRDAELTMLERVLAQCISRSEANALLVVAPPGIGKSRLRYELLRRVRAREEVQVWIARADSIGAGSPFGMAAQMIRSTAGIFQDEPEDVRRDKLRSRVALHVTESMRHRVTCFLGEVIGARFPDGDDVELRAARRDAVLMGDQSRRALVDFVGAECAHRPLLVVLEDLQWGDLPTVAAVEASLRLFARRPFVVLAFARPEAERVFPDVWRTWSQLSLGGLANGDAGALVHAALGKDADEALVQRLVGRAAGNVFYLEELVRAAAEARLHGSDAPATVLAMVQSRLATLDARARRVLRAASVFGQTCWESGIASLLDEGARESIAVLDELHEREFLTRRAQSRFVGEVEYVFRHALVRDAAYATLTDGDRVLGHRLAGVWLERMGERSAIVIAEHLDEGGDEARAAECYRRAAEQAFEANDFAEAFARAERGVACGARGELMGALRLIQAESHVWRGGTDAILATASEAAELLPPGHGPWGEALSKIASARFRRGQTAELEQVARRLLEALGDPRNDVAALARSGARTASFLFLSQRGELATALIDAASRASHDDAETRAAVHAALAYGARAEDDFVRYLGHMAESEAAHRARGAERRVCEAAVMRGDALLGLGAYEEAATLLEATLETAERMGLGALEAAARNTVAPALLALGRVDDARAMSEAALDAFIAQNDQRMEGDTRQQLASAFLDLNDTARAEVEARRAVTLLEAGPSLRPHALATLAEVLLRKGETHEALAVATDAMRELEAGRCVVEAEAPIRLVLARALEAAGRDAEARETIACAHARLRERAAAIEDPTYRKTFLDIPRHAMTIALDGRLT